MLFGLPAGRRADPALGPERARVRAPEARVAVRGPGDDVHGGAPGHEVAEDGRVPDGVADGQGHGRVEPDGLVADGVERGEGLEEAGEVVGFRRGGGGEGGADFGAEAGLDVGVRREEERYPGEC